MSLASAALWAGTPADLGHAEGPVAVSGSYFLTLNVRLDRALPAGAAILCKARIAPNLPSLQSLNERMVPADWAASVATVTGNSATCSLRIPFSWAVSDPRGGVGLSYEVDAVGPSSSLAGPVGARQGIGVAYPAPGGTSRLMIGVN
jgi:hypothetical protein